MTPRAAGVFTYSPRTPAAPHVCILMAVPNRTIYLDRELDDHVKRLDLNVSQVCQKALRVEVERAIRNFYTPLPSKGRENSTHREAS